MLAGPMGYLPLQLQLFWVQEQVTEVLDGDCIFICVDDSMMVLEDVVHAVLNGVTYKEPVNSCLLGLANAMDPANGLQLSCWVEDGLHQDDMGRLNDVQAVCTRGDGQQQGTDKAIAFE